MPDDVTDVVVGGFIKNDREMITGYISLFRGNKYVHLRTFVPSAVDEGEWIRTQKGIAFLPGHFDLIRRAVHSMWDLTGTDVVMARISRNDNEEIRVGMNEFRGDLYCYVRIFYMSETGKWVPSSKGISVSTSRLEDLETLLDTIADSLNG